MFGSTSEQRLNIPLVFHTIICKMVVSHTINIVWFCSVDFHPSLEHVQHNTLQRASLQNSAKHCIHVDSSLYAFVSKVQYWLIKEGISVEN